MFDLEHSDALTSKVQSQGKLDLRCLEAANKTEVERLGSDDRHCNSSRYFRLVKKLLAKFLV